MVLPESFTAALILLLFATCCFVVWPNLFKLGGSKWRFELFSVDFAVGSVVLAALAAYTLGSRGSELDFSDSMLVAGRRAEVVAMAAGAVFALGNMLYFGTMALLGLSNGTLLTFSVFGFTVGLLHLVQGPLLLFATASLLLIVAAFLASAAARAARPAVKVAPSSRATRPDQHKAPMSPVTKGSITGVLSGLSLGAVWPVLSSAQTDQFGIGAYGGVLMGSLGVLIATLLLNFFFMNISLEGGSVSFATYLSGTPKQHLLGMATGCCWTAGALALYTAKTGNTGLSRLDAWLVPFAGALLSVMTGVLFWQKMQLTPQAIRTKWAAAALFVLGSAVLIAGMRR